MIERKNSRHKKPAAPNPSENPGNSAGNARIELANRLFFRLYQCANMLHKTGTRAVEAEGLTTQQWAVLGALSRPAAGWIAMFLPPSIVAVAETASDGFGGASFHGAVHAAALASSP